MIKRTQQNKSQYQPINSPIHAIFKPRSSQKSEISSTSSFVMSSFQNIGEPIYQKPKISKREQKLSTNLFNNPRSSKLKMFQEIKQNEKEQIQLIEQKMQNVSCLYSNFVYKNQQKNFIDDMKLERYRMMVENQRGEKNQLMKDIDDLKWQLKESEREKETVMFAYRALQTKIRQKQKMIRMKLLRGKDRNQKLSINISNSLQANQTLQGSLTSMLLDAELMKSRQMLTSQGILSLDEQGNSEKLISCLNKFCSSKEMTKYLEKENGVKEWEERERLFDSMEKELQELRPKVERLEEREKVLEEEKDSLQGDVQFYREEYNKAMSRVADCEQQVNRQKQTISSLHTDLTNMTTKFNEINIKFTDQERQAQRKQRLIEQLENTKYTYLMKQEKERQQMQLLKKFTENLQLNDEKINEFIQSTFGNQVQTEIKSENKLFKEDISYILHLIKKKENIYNELIKEYQEKLRETETRCFLVEKKLHLTDLFVKKLEAFVEGQIQLCGVGRVNNNAEIGSHSNNHTKKAENKQASKQSPSNTQSANGLKKIVQTMKSLLDNYYLDKRII